jgi:transposase
MNSLLSHQATDWREGRRLRAYELAQQGWKQRTIAQALGVTEGAVSQWLKRARTQGTTALQKRSSPGAPPKLTPQQKAYLPTLLAQGAPAFGFVGDVWTAKRVGDVWTAKRVGVVIERQWHVRYHDAYVAKLLHACGWSRQKPTRRARQRNEAAIQEWHEVRLPALKQRR